MLSLNVRTPVHENNHTSHRVQDPSLIRISQQVGFCCSLFCSVAVLLYGTCCSLYVPYLSIMVYRIPEDTGIPSPFIAKRITIFSCLITNFENNVSYVTFVVCASRESLSDYCPICPTCPTLSDSCPTCPKYPDQLKQVGPNTRTAVRSDLSD